MQTVSTHTRVRLLGYVWMKARWLRKMQWQMHSAISNGSSVTEPYYVLFGATLGITISVVGVIEVNKVNLNVFVMIDQKAVIESYRHIIWTAHHPISFLVHFLRWCCSVLLSILLYCMLTVAFVFDIYKEKGQLANCIWVTSHTVISFMYNILS